MKWGGTCLHTCSLHVQFALLAIFVECTLCLCERLLHYSVEFKSLFFIGKSKKYSQSRVTPIEVNAMYLSTYNSIMGYIQCAMDINLPGAVILHNYIKRVPRSIPYIFLFHSLH